MYNFFILFYFYKNWDFLFFFILLSMEGNNKNDNSNNEKSESIFNNEIKDFSIQIQNDISKLSKDFIQNKKEIIRNILNNESIKRRLLPNRINR